MTNKRINVGVHIHTHYSYDSNLSPAVLVRAARGMGLDCIAVTDHNLIDGALEAAEIGGIRVVIGEEVSTRDGHILGLFLREAVPPRMSGEETCAAIHEQGGVALAAHPFASLCRSSLGDSLERLSPHLDGIEVHNGQNPLRWEDWRAARFARRAGMPEFVGMDAHLRWLPAAYQRMADFADAREFMDSLATAELVRGRVGLRYIFLMALRHYWDAWMPWSLPGFGGREVAARELEIVPEEEALV